MPTRWFGGILIGLFLIGSAAFGGLNDVPVAALPEAEVDEPVTGQQFEITVERAVLIDGLPDLSITPDDERDRLLAIVMTVENVWTETMGTADSIGLGGNYRILDTDGSPAAGLVDGVPPLYVRWDDTTNFPRFQPGVPAQIAAFWDVDADAYADGDELTIEIIDRTFREQGFVTYGGMWERETPIARVPVVIEDVGSGDATEEGDG